MGYNPKVGLGWFPPEKGINKPLIMLIQLPIPVKILLQFMLSNNFCKLPICYQNISPDLSVIGNLILIPVSFSHLRRWDSAVLYEFHDFKAKD